MKYSHVALALFVSPFISALSAYSQSFDYRMISVPQAEVDHYLTPGSTSTQTPDNLQGLWWMDGNPLADKVVSFAGVTFTPITEDDVVTGYECYLPVYDQGVWSWDDTQDGHDLYNNVLASRLTYHAVFNKDFTHGEVMPLLQVLPKPFPEWEIPQSMLLQFSMTLTAPGEYSRDSLILGKPFTYRFRRVVDGAGQRLPTYDEYTAALKAHGFVNAWLPICEADSTGKVLPTACASH